MRKAEMGENPKQDNNRADMKTGHRKPALSRYASIGLFMSALFICSCTYAGSFSTEASYYSVESCKREGTWQKYGGRMANGERFLDGELVCASWDYPFGTMLKVTSQRTQKSIICKVTDRGPSKRLYRRGRRIDLSRGAFSRIDDLNRGITKVIVEEI